MNEKINNLIVFSEGAIHQATYTPILESLTKKRIPFTYISLDPSDPLLKKKINGAKLIHWRKNLFLPLKFGFLKADYLLSTTPHIGSPGYILPRPNQIKILAHVFHALSDTCFYKKGALDNYDKVFACNEEEVTNIRRVEAARGLKTKQIYISGLPYFDFYKDNAKHFIDKSNLIKTRPIILFATSWGEKNLFNFRGMDLLRKLSASGFDVIVRFHPFSRHFEQKRIEQYTKIILDLGNIVIDENHNPMNAMAKSDVLISDCSSIRFDFCFLFEKPVVSIELPAVNKEQFEITYHSDPWIARAGNLIGRSFVFDECSEVVVRGVRELLENFDSSKLKDLRRKYCVNFGYSADMIVNEICRDILDRTGV